MRKTIFILFICFAIVWVTGCGSQNEYLSKGKEWVKSDKRGKIQKAVAQFELAIEKEPNNAEAHYLLGYYDENSTIERRAEQMVLAYKNNKKKYLKILIEETLRDRNDNIRKSAVLALQTIHSKIDPIIKPLIKTLKSKDARDRDNAALVLSKLNKHKEVIERLMQEDIIKHKRMGTRFDAVRALGNIGDPKAIDALMERITTLKTEGEKGEESEVRRAAISALKQISKRKIEIKEENSRILDIQFESAEEGIKIAQDITGDLANKTTFQKDEIISSVINNKKVLSMDSFKIAVEEAILNESVTFGIPKLVKVRASSIDELGIIFDKKNTSKGGIVVDGLTIESKAGKLGIEKGELISYINDKQLNSVDDYEKIVSESIAKGEDLTFTIANDDKYKEITVFVPEIPQIEETSDMAQELNLRTKEQKKGSIEKKPKIDQLAKATPNAELPTIEFSNLGIVVQALPTGTEGVVIKSLKPQSPAVEAGLRIGQVIGYVVSEKKIQNSEQFKQLVKEGLDDGKVTISTINKTAINKLIEVLRNKGLIVRFDAAIALGELRDKVAVDSLIEMLQEQANPIEMKL